MNLPKTLFTTNKSEKDEVKDEPLQYNNLAGNNLLKLPDKSRKR